MSTDLAEMQFELLPSLTADSGFVFGIGASVSVNEDGFLPGDDDWTHEDEQNPRRGGVNFGREVLNGPTWGWNLHINEKDVPSAVDTLGAFKTAWRALAIRQTPGAIIPIRYRLNDRYRRIYGRPRRFSAPPANGILNGYVPVTVDFACVDGFVYDDEESSVSLQLNSGSDGGFILPATFPVTTLPVGLNEGQAVVGGDAPAYPVIRFNGPVTNPSVATDAWTLSLDRSIAAGDYVEIDLRPWALTALLNGTSSVGGDLGRRTYLSDIKLEPGPHTLVFRGGDETGSATCEVRWSNAWNSI
jgi:hypothetical protein